MTSDSRLRMTRSAARLIGACGMNGTSFSDVIADSRAPRGSIYHHFPQGKEQLAAEAIGWMSEQISAYQEAAPTDSPEQVLAHFVEFWRRSATDSQGSNGCPVTGVAVDTSAGAPIMTSVRQAFDSWARLLQGQLETAGLPRARARPIALTTLACMEGALILCKAEGSSAPMKIAAAELLRVTRGNLS